MKKSNPHTPILIREAMGTEPKVFARYGAWFDGYYSLCGNVVTDLYILGRIRKGKARVAKRSLLPARTL